MNKKMKRKHHYYRKLKYELMRGGDRFDYREFRKCLRASETLHGVLQRNKDWLYVNPLGVRSVRMPF